MHPNPAHPNQPTRPAPPTQPQPNPNPNPTPTQPRPAPPRPAPCRSRQVYDNEWVDERAVTKDGKVLNGYFKGLWLGKW